MCAVKASAEVTVIDYTDADHFVTWYALTTSATKPAVPTTTIASQTPDAPWSSSEPAYEAGTTSYLHTCIQTVWGDGSCDWGDVQLSSSYEAAKQAANRADAAKEQANEVQENLSTLGGDLGDNLARLSESVDTRISVAGGEILTAVEAAYVTGAQLEEAMSSVEQATGAIEARFTSLIGDLSQTDADLRKLTSWLRAGSDDGIPFLDMGNGQTEFRSRLTNTALAFLNGESEIASFGNHMTTPRAEVTEELDVGSWAWISRANGNLALKWIGA